MFGFFKKLKSKPESESAEGAVIAPPPPRIASTALPASNPAAHRASTSTAVSAAPPPAAPAAPQHRMQTAGPGPSANATSGGAPAAAEPEASIEVPYKALFTKLNPDIQKLAARQPKSSETLRLPVSRIQSQLASGSVKLTFAELRQYSPAGLFAQNGHEGDLVLLPLSELLPRLKPEHLGRRSVKKIEVPKDLDDVFGPGGTKLRISEKPSAGAAPKPKSSAETIADFKAKLAAAAAAQGGPPPAAQPSAPIPGPAPELRAAPAAPAATVPAPAIPLTTVAPSSEASTGPIKAPSLDPALAGAAKKPVRNVLTLPLAEFGKHWSAAGKEQLAGLCPHSAEIPMDLIEMGLKRGKLVYPWTQFKTWVQPAEGSALPELANEEQIDLPLAMVAPRFMAQHKPLRKQKKIKLSDEIPDVFGPREGEKPAGTPAPASAAAPATATPATPAAAVPQNGASKPAPAPINDIGDVFGQPGRTNWTLQEIVQHTGKLPGVAGALIGTTDGLLVASAWPPGVRPDTVAAFVPQMHGRVTQFSNHLKMNEPEHFTLVLNDLPLQIFKANTTYFIVVGNVGESLPGPLLTVVAKRLSQNTSR